MTKFEGNIKTLITDVKYSYYFVEMHTLAIFLANYMKTMQVLPCPLSRILLPISLHPKKQRERGFNQRELLTREISKICKIPTTSKLLRKTKQTRSQAGLKREERLKNVEQSFTCTIKLKKSDTIVLIDGVVATRAALSSCAKILKRAGAGKVFGIALAHGH